MYLVILFMIPEVTSFYLIPDEVIDPIKSHLERLVNICINVNDTKEDLKSYDIIEKEMDKWESYRITKGSLHDKDTRGTYIIEYLV